MNEQKKRINRKQNPKRNDPYGRAPGKPPATKLTSAERKRKAITKMAREGDAYMKRVMC